MRSGAGILVPIDFSERSAPAARYAGMLAAQFDSPLVLLHVLQPLDVSGLMTDELTRQRAARFQQELDAFLPGELPNGPVTRVVAEGDPTRVIVDYAHRQAGLIVMPTHG